MNVLIVYAHPEPMSFCGALKDRAVTVLRAAGHGVEVSDLHAEGFDPVPSRRDFASVADPSLFHYQAEQLNAAKNAGFAPDIAREQARLARADALILQYPMWWGGPPAILKGWCDRVLAYGFAYVDGRRFDTGLFKGRRAMISVTTGGTIERYAADGVYGEIAHALYQPQRLTLEYLGYETEAPFVAYAAPRVDAGQRQQYLDDFAARALAMAAKPVTRSDGPEAADSGASAWTRSG